MVINKTTLLWSVQCRVSSASTYCFLVCPLFLPSIVPPLGSGPPSHIRLSVLPLPSRVSFSKCKPDPGLSFGRRGLPLVWGLDEKNNMWALDTLSGLAPSPFQPHLVPLPLLLYPVYLQWFSFRLCTFYTPFCPR